MALVTVISALLLAAGLFFVLRFIRNERFLASYRKEVYNEQIEEPLLNFNVMDPYLPYYNIANVCYQKQEYDVAIAFYREALEMNPSHPKECSIRVNLALSMLQKIDFSNLSSTKRIETVIRQLLAARGILTEEECAHPETDEGHSEEAELLKKDIDEMLEKLREMLENPPEQQQQQQQSQSQQNQHQSQGQSPQEQQLQQQLQQQMQQAMQEHVDAQNTPSGDPGGYGYGGDQNSAVW